jgi:hypothetical protein
MLPAGTVDHARLPATLFEAMLEKIAATGMHGRQSERCGARRQANVRDKSIRDCASKNGLRDPLRNFSARFLLDTRFRFRAVLLDTPRRVEMEVSSFATSKVRALLDTYFDPSLLDTLMQNLTHFGAPISCWSQQDGALRGYDLFCYKAERG